MKLLQRLLKVLAILLIVGGILTMAASYYALHIHTRTIHSFHAPYGNMNGGQTAFKVAMFSDNG